MEPRAGARPERPNLEKPRIFPWQTNGLQYTTPQAGFNTDEPDEPGPPNYAAAWGPDPTDNEDDEEVKPLELPTYNFDDRQPVSRPHNPADSRQPTENDNASPRLTDNETGVEPMGLPVYKW